MTADPEPFRLFGDYLRVTGVAHLGPEPAGAPELLGKRLGLLNGSSWITLWSNYFGRRYLPGVHLVNMGNEALQLNFMEAHAARAALPAGGQHPGLRPLRPRPGGVCPGAGRADHLLDDEPGLRRGGAGAGAPGRSRWCRSIGPMMEQRRRAERQDAGHRHARADRRQHTGTVAGDGRGDGTGCGFHRSDGAGSLGSAGRRRRGRPQPGARRRHSAPAGDQEEIGCVVLAQLSMTVFLLSYPDPVAEFGIPVLTSGQCGFEHMRRLMASLPRPRAWSIG